MAYKDPKKRKDCSARHYQKNRQKYIERAAGHKLKARQALRDWIKDYLLAHPCVDCGEPNIACLEFDHIDQANKVLSISEMRSRAWSVSAVKIEIEKCVVRCANCHRKRTAKQLGWWSHLETEENV